MRHLFGIGTPRSLQGLAARLSTLAGATMTLLAVASRFMLRRWMSTRLADRISGSAAPASARRHFRPSSTGCYAALLPNLNAGRVELLDERRLVAQLLGLERRTARGGRDSIDHAPNAHDDVANAVAGAVVNAAVRSGFPDDPRMLVRHIRGRPLSSIGRFLRE
jgi:hypothetical protein